MASCRGCPIGAAHAGKPVVTHSVLFEMDICPRCRVGSARRLIGGREAGMIGGVARGRSTFDIGNVVCISCYNRQREIVVGRNSKGTAPTKLPPLSRRSIRVLVAVDGGGRIMDYEVPMSLDTVELVLNVLRAVPGRAIFGRRVAAPAVRQGRLF